MATATRVKTIEVHDNRKDTSGLIIKVCRRPPGKEKNGADYEASVCVYRYLNGKPILYKVVSFDLVYNDQKTQTSKVFRINGNTFHPVKSFILSLDTSALPNLFLDNVTFIGSDKDTVIAKGIQRRIFEC